MFVISTLNINGLNDRNKQGQVINFMKYNKIDILLLQEHNIKDINVISKELNDFCFISLNPSISLKGGTAVLICKSLPYDIVSEEKSADSRIISLKVKIYDQFIHLVNVYAHSGNNQNVDRENLFNNELLYYLRNSLQYTFIGGDWNCVLSERDSSSNNTPMSKSLLTTVRTLNLKDVWFLKHRNVEYTYVRSNAGSRIDRAYVKDLASSVLNVKTIHVNFSDHSCIWTELDLKGFPKRGKSYWKLNVALLNDVNIKESFKTEWVNICSKKKKFNCINDWWDLYAKKQIKLFFIKKGKQMSEKKYGLIQYLEFCLNNLYCQMNTNNILQYEEVKILKDRIDELKNDILEGVRIRSRMSEQVEGEKVSAFLIKQQAGVKTRKMMSQIKTEAGIIENLDSNVILKEKDSISLYVRKYYEKLYGKENYNVEHQNFFLQFITKTLSDHERRILELEVTQNEIYKTIKDMNLNKAPGIDGIPIEFYLKYWDLIKTEITEIITNIIKGSLLNDNQRKAIITLLPKNGDLSLLKQWRPISLICCDVKIVAKLLAKRIKPLLFSLLSENQFCIEGRSIVDCTTKIRDIMYYLGKNNKTGAVINIDWEKAFDKVNWDFLFKILKRMKFPDFVIKWISVLYTNIQSVCLINGFFTDSFNIYKGVRQGCPLSMLFFVIFQDPLYIALKRANNIKPIDIPGDMVLHMGYADDTNIFTSDDRSFVEIFRIIHLFEVATNSKLNIKKTKVYGYGNWKNRIHWPVNDLKVEVDYFSALGIIYSSDYDTALNTMWTNVYNKIKNRVPLITCRKFTLYQRVILVNCLIASKLWYVSHVYPLPLKYVTCINQ